MATRRSSRATARRRSAAARSRAVKSQYSRPLRYEPLEDRRLLAVVTVDTPDDTVNFTDGRTSLREAIFATNVVGGADTIQFAPGDDLPYVVNLPSYAVVAAYLDALPGPGPGPADCPTRPGRCSVATRSISTAPTP